MSHCPERKLLKIVGGIIGTNEIDFTTEFPRLGLTSISAMKLSIQIYKKFGVTVNVKELFTATIKSIENKLLQAFLSEQRNKQKISSVVESSKITGVQRGIYLECVKDPPSTTYNMPLIYNFDADIVTSMIAYRSKDTEIIALPSNNSYTMQVLYRLGYS